MAKLPGYLGLAGRLWLARGGNYAVANTRGGAEYGPAWHDQAVRANRHKVAENFASVARDLVTQGVTLTAAQLGAIGGSAGGLLILQHAHQYPELFGAWLASSHYGHAPLPLTSCRRSWIAEFGDPDEPAEWEFIKGRSWCTSTSPRTPVSANTDHHVDQR